MRKRILLYDDTFKQELIEIIKYISFDLKNPSAAERLSNAVKSAILKRYDFPGTFEPHLLFCSQYQRFIKINSRQSTTSLFVCFSTPTGVFFISP